MTYSDLKARLAESEATLEILRDRQLSYMTAFKALQELWDVVGKQEDSERKTWWLKRLKSLEGIFNSFDKDGGEIARLQIALDGQTDRVAAVVERCQELEEENRKLRDML